MAEIFRFLKTAETYIYILLSAVGFIYLRRFINSLMENRLATFGLEKDYARRQMVSAISIGVLLFFLAIAEFTFVTIGSNNPDVIGLLPTPTMNISGTATPATGAGLSGIGQGDSLLASPQCQSGKVEWTYPAEGETIRGKVEVKGTASIENFGFYKYEYSQDNIQWTPLVVGTAIVTNNALGAWDTSLLAPGDYYLRLVVYDNQENAQSPCVVRISVQP
jgi:hypothetical protein